MRDHHDTTTATIANDVGQADRFPAVLPAEDFPTFRSTCRRTLNTAAFARVDALLTAEAGALQCQLDAGLAITVEAVASWLHARYLALATDAEVLTATRAAQVVLFRRGWFLQVDTAGLLAAAADCPRPAARTVDHWRRLAVYRQPHRGTICALAASDFSLTEMTGLHLGDVAADGSTVTTADGSVRTIEAGAQVYLRAQLLARAFDGARPQDPLLVSEHGRPMATRPIADVISRARVETGLALTSRRVARDRMVGDRWRTRWGISLQPLDGGTQ